ncbi:rhoptry protein [Fictibacillus macauensis ZFHKF-1]|uniref:Rhoptry protein n=1 Tax=Fictibacillus macauensis ZFHKF-1 TaxID=1196324 RepID=I8UAY9_9BACL|nr:hypothetical protein [Fictibacillus macauensis]EIT84090.1 rhoptry protein [Fictibacillus macauensis ZFHKF-1]
MNYPYTITKTPLGRLTIKLPKEIEIFEDFVGVIFTEEDALEVVEYIDKVIDGTYEHFEYSINGISVDMKKEETTVHNPFYEQNDLHYEDTMETDQFRELVLIWKDEVLGNPEY